MNEPDGECEENLLMTMNEDISVTNGITSILQTKNTLTKHNSKSIPRTSVHNLLICKCHKPGIH